MSHGKTIKMMKRGMLAAVAAFSFRAAAIRPPDAAHAPATRRHEGIASIAASPVNGRMWAAWYACTKPCEDKSAYVVVATSADGGETWKEVLVHDPDGEGPIWAFDPQLWVAPDGKLRLFWPEMMDHAWKPGADGGSGGWTEAGFKGSRLMMLELDAENEPPAGGVRQAPRRVAHGVMACKPTVLRDGAWLFPVAHSWEEPSTCIYVSTDGCRTFEMRGGVTLPKEWRQFDEPQAVELEDGALRVYIRVKKGPHGRWAAESRDGGRTWSAPHPCDFPCVNARIFVSRLASGNLLMVKNGRPGEPGNGRRDLTAYISEDDGRSWPFALVLDGGRNGVAYPDGQQLPDGRIVLAYDYDRVRSRQILFATFREEDVRAGRLVSPGSRLRLPVNAGASAVSPR